MLRTQWRPSGLASRESEWLPGGQSWGQQAEPGPPSAMCRPGGTSRCWHSRWSCKWQLPLGKTYLYLERVAFPLKKHFNCHHFRGYGDLPLIRFLHCGLNLEHLAGSQLRVHLVLFLHLTDNQGTEQRASVRLNEGRDQNTVFLAPGLSMFCYLSRVCSCPALRNMQAV